MNREIHDDVERWSDRKLTQWVADSMMRYELAEVDQRLAFASVAASVMLLLAQMAAEAGVPSEEAGRQLAHCIDAIRNKRRGAQVQ